MRIVVNGGAGLVRSKTVALLRAAAREVPGARTDTGVNTITGEGRAQALLGADVVIDLVDSRHDGRDPDA